MVSYLTLILTCDFRLPVSSDLIADEDYTTGGSGYRNCVVIQ